MNCPSCQTKARILEVRPGDNSTRRRYSCACGGRFTTRETIEAAVPAKQAFREQVSVAIKLLEAALKEKF
jgi:transcriptional regulator NrdR family protein